METGLRDESLVANLRPFLRQGGVTDEELMKHLNDLATVQAERKAKSYSAPAERQRAAAANAAFVDSEAIKPQKPKIQKQTTHENESETKTLSAEVRELRSELAELKRNFAGKRMQQAPRFQKNRGRGRGQYQGQGYYRRQSGCRQCQANGIGNTCQHCFNCRGIDHFRAQCPVQENSQRLFQGGEE